MELQFDKTLCPCIQKVISKPQTQELTQELRLPDTMPDIGRILGCWGQSIIRGKEWSGSSITVTGGIMAWLLYAPEDGSAPQSWDAWMPFQMRWELPQTQRDGFIRVEPFIKAMDCRSLSARKLMLRAGVTLVADAMEPTDITLWQPGACPDDVQLLKQTYPMELPEECGEKPFQLEEELQLPGNLPPLEKMVRCQVIPKVTEQKVMAGKLVFRGACSVHMLFTADDGMLNPLDFEMPFSQLADLDKDYGTGATADICTVVTGLEPYRDPEGKMMFKCGLAAQYVIFDRCMVELVEDAYSNVRTVKPQTELLQLPVRLDVRSADLQISQIISAEVQRVIDTAICTDHPTVRQSGNQAQAELAFQFQMLYESDSGMLQSAVMLKQENWSMESDPENQVQVCLIPGSVNGYVSADGLEASADLVLEATVYSQKGIPMVTGLELGELREPDPSRPSLVLRRCNNDSLWEIAKACGSTVEAICDANQLQQEPVNDRMLLIPVL